VSDGRQERAAPEPVASLRLRPERPSVTRLSRRVLVGGTALALVAVFGAAFWALQSNRHRGAPEELYSTDHRTTADGLAGLPRDYAGLPRPVPPLGPPLPGDLGRPLHDAPAPPAVAPGPDPEAQRRAQEIEAARLSRLFVSTSLREVPIPALAPAAPASDAGASPGPAAPSSTDAAFAQNGQDRKLAFVNAAVDRRTTSPDRLAAPASPYVVQAGTVIPGALITGIRSDLPGAITAQVTEDVYDSRPAAGC